MLEDLVNGQWVDINSKVQILRQVCVSMTSDVSSDSLHLAGYLYMHCSCACL